MVQLNADALSADLIKYLGDNKKKIVMSVGDEIVEIKVVDNGSS